MKEIREYGFKYLVRAPKGGSLPADFSEEVARRVERFHQQLPGYRPTDLVRWSHLAEAWGVKGVFIKDESTRFNLKAFKVLGGSYAVARLMCQKLGMSPDDIDFAYLVSDEARKRIGQITFTTATDGNHGRGIAWAAEQLHQNAVIYMPKGAARSRVENIRSHGATVIVTDLNYDDAVRLCCRMAEENGWNVIQDTAWEGYTEIPLWIMQGYMTMCVEAVNQMALTGLRPTHVFVQVGVGALAGAVVGCLLNKFSNHPPRFITMEPNNAACIFASATAADGRPHAVTGDLNTVMAGLACGEPNPIGLGYFARLLFLLCELRRLRGRQRSSHPGQSVERRHPRGGGRVRGRGPGRAGSPLQQRQIWGTETGAGNRFRFNPALLQYRRGHRP